MIFSAAGGGGVIYGVEPFVGPVSVSLLAFARVCMAPVLACLTLCSCPKREQDSSLLPAVRIDVLRSALPVFGPGPKAHAHGRARWGAACGVGTMAPRATPKVKLAVAPLSQWPHQLTPQTIALVLDVMFVFPRAPSHAPRTRCHETLLCITHASLSTTGVVLEGGWGEITPKRLLDHAQVRAPYNPPVVGSFA